MRTTALLWGAALFALPPLAATAADTKADAVKEIELQDLKKKPAFGKPEPREIKTADELAKALPDEDAVAKVKKEVDFAKQKVVLFAWEGSGRDRVDSTADKGAVTFTYAPGMSRDLRGHVHVFAVPKDAAVKMGGAKEK